MCRGAEAIEADPMSTSDFTVGTEADKACAKQGCYVDVVDVFGQVVTIILIRCTKFGITSLEVVACEFSLIA